MKSMAVLNKFFNTNESGQKVKQIGEFKQELDQLTIEEKNELGALAAAELGVEFEPSGT